MRISPGRRYVVGDQLTIADLSLCGYLFWPEEIGVDWDAYPGDPRLARADTDPSRAGCTPTS